MQNSTRDRWIVAGLIALSVVPAIAGSVRVGQLIGGVAVTPENARFVHAPWPVLLHLPAAVLYSIAGALQFSTTLRRRRAGWHRMAGRLLLPMGALVAATGLWMTLTYPWPAGDGWMVFVERMVVGVAMLAFLALGLRAIQRRAFAVHGEWMIRAYALGLGAGTQVLTHLPWFVLMERAPDELARGVMMGAGWAINAVVAEWAIRRVRAGQTVTRATTRRTSGATTATVGNATDQVVAQLRSQVLTNP